MRIEQHYYQLLKLNVSLVNRLKTQLKYTKNTLTVTCLMTMVYLLLITMTMTGTTDDDGFE